MIVALGNKNRLSEGVTSDQINAFKGLACDNRWKAVTIRVGHRLNNMVDLIREGERTSSKSGGIVSWWSSSSYIRFGFDISSIIAFYDTNRGVFMKDASGITSHHFIGLQLKNLLYVTIQFA
jgi:hypothetical protein